MSTPDPKKGYPLSRAAVTLVRYGHPQEQIVDLNPRRGKGLGKSRVLRDLGIGDSKFRDHAHDLGGRTKPENQQLKFFAAPTDRTLAFGAGAGLALGISLGSSSLRALLVDANGWIYHLHEADPDPSQLSYSPDRLFRRIREAASHVLGLALNDDWLTVEERNEKGEIIAPRYLPLLGCGIAWPAPVSREFRLRSDALSSSAWRNARSLRTEARRQLGLEAPCSYAMNDAAAAAIALAHDQTHGDGYGTWRHPHLATVLRLGGGVGAASIIVEPPFVDFKSPGFDDLSQSGFPKSILIGGIDKGAGEIGHLPVRQELIDSLNEDRPDGLGPLVPVACGCVKPRRGQPGVLDHVESFASARAIAHRLNPEASMNAVLDNLRKSPDIAIHRRAMQDVGAVVADALLGPVAALNPASITVTGSLATDVVTAEIGARLRGSVRVNSAPKVKNLEGFANKFVCAKGAGLAIVRREVHRNLNELLGEGKLETGREDLLDERKEEARRRISGLTFQLRASDLPLRPRAD